VVKGNRTRNIMIVGATGDVQLLVGAIVHTVFKIIYGHEADKRSDRPHTSP